MGHPCHIEIVCSEDDVTVKRESETDKKVVKMSLKQQARLAARS